jgi:hypothetical protein
LLATQEQVAGSSGEKIHPFADRGRGSLKSTNLDEPMATSSKKASAGSIQLKNRVTCPHCWNVFPPEQTLWIAQHPDLVGDPRLGSDHPQRFLPTRFTLGGAALDAKGFECHGLACPKCHLSIPRALYEMKSVFLSILGTPACGKSYFLASMTWQLRKILPRYFGLAFGDADPMANQILHQYEELQFLNSNQDALVKIQKTEEQGDLYDSVLYQGETGTVRYPRPFLFMLRPLESHPNHAAAGHVSRSICLYDNAGESFLPGADKATSPVTRHLALSQALFFLFDPTQDPRFRQACHGKSADPQIQIRTTRLAREGPLRQDVVLQEAAARVRRYAALGQNARHSRPLIVVVTKYDAWSNLLDTQRITSPWSTKPSGYGISSFNLEDVDRTSQKLRKLLWDLCPEIVSVAEGFAKEVVFVPVSATGRGPETDPATGADGIRPRDINPVWVEVPILYTLCKWMPGIIPYAKPPGPDTIPFGGPPLDFGTPHAAIAGDRARPRDKKELA